LQSKKEEIENKLAMLSAEIERKSNMVKRKEEKIDELK
jgi:uncharacterized small protein (DUF1192 family)